jgi:sugar lactone lactonase YvrE/DNA-binding transcriptional ArsR family regulator
LEQDSGSQDFDATKAELFEAISHPVRIKILEALNEKPMGFAELGRVVGIESGGHLSFHLTKLRHLIRTNSQGDYTLTGEGKEALWTIRALQKSGRETSTIAGRLPLRHRSLLKPVVAIILVAVVVLGGFEFYQQSQFSSLQRQVNSQQGVIVNLEGDIPFVNGQPASLVIGQKDFESNWQFSSLNGLSGPTQALFDNSGNLWVVDPGNSRVLEYEPPFATGMQSSLVLGLGNPTLLGACGCVSHPVAAAFDMSGNLWVSDEGYSRVVEYAHPFHSGMAASIVIGQPNLTAVVVSPYLSSRILNSPTGIAFDASGSLWVLDNGNDRVLEFNPPFRNGMNASLVLGQPNFESSTLSKSMAGLSYCSCHGLNGLAIDPTNNVWVGDPDNDRILEFRPPFSNGMNASLVIDQQNLVANKTKFAGYGYVATSGLGLSIAFDRQGNLWAAYSNRLMVFKPPFIPDIRAYPSVEIGQPNFTATAWLGGQAGLFNPGRPAFDSQGNLWVPDTYNNRVLEFVANPGSEVPGQTIVNAGPIGIGVVSAVVTGAVGISVAFWYRSRAQRHLSTRPFPI